MKDMTMQERAALDRWITREPDEGSYEADDSPDCDAEMPEGYEAPDYENEVIEADACPNCGERRMEQLVNRDGVVTCGSCHTTYDLEPGREEAPDAS
jgi:formylmethanofuran dehydrogenase subunit E